MLGRKYQFQSPEKFPSYNITTCPCVTNACKCSTPSTSLQYQIRFGQCLPWHVPKLSLSTVRYDANPRQMLLDLYTRGVHKIDWQKIFTIFQDFFATNMSDHAGEKGRVCWGSGFDKVLLTVVATTPPEENMTRKTIFWPRPQNSRLNNSVLSENSQSARTQAIWLQKHWKKCWKEKQIWICPIFFVGLEVS